jgi:prepilin-type N-terminal cleavage/methylation domain-containing protein
MRKIKQKAIDGFTLIELLIVIALLGILAIGLLAAIDPIEQVRRGQDSSLQNLAAEFYNAQTRYYTNNQRFTSAGVWSANAAALSGLTADVTALLNGGEVKAQFQSQVTNQGASVFVTCTAGSGSNACSAIAVCYQPTSKQGRTNVNNICNNDGSSCSGAPGSTRYTCIQ